MSDKPRVVDVTVQEIPAAGGLLSHSAYVQATVTLSDGTTRTATDSGWRLFGSDEPSKDAAIKDALNKV